MQGDFKITWVLPNGETEETSGWRKLNVLAHADTFDLDIPQACGGHGECGTCRIRILEGELTPIRHEEATLMTRHAKRFKDRERLACQCRPTSDVRIALLAMMPRDLREIEEEEEQGV